MAEPAAEKLSSGTGMLFAAMLATVVVSLGGIAYAKWFGIAADGGRGGAIGVALTFFMLFLGRGTAEKALEAPMPASGDLAKDTAQDLSKVRGAVAAMLDWSGKEKLYLTVSSVFATLAWGFGDWIAAWIGAPTC